MWQDGYGRLVKRIASLVLVALLIVACAQAQYEIDGLSCDGETYERIVLDVDPSGVETEREALADFVFGPVFQNRADWVALSRVGDASTPDFHAYADDDGRVRLIVELRELPGGWYVSEYRHCG